MAPIPMEMDKWSPSLFKLLTVDFFETKSYKKVAPNDKYTTSNIPVLVALIIFLEREGVLNFQSMMETARGQHHSKGSLKCTYAARSGSKTDPCSWADIRQKTWLTKLPFRVQMLLKDGSHVKLSFCELVQFILFRECEKIEKNSIHGFHDSVNLAAKTLSANKLESIATTGKIALAKIKPEQIDSEADDLDHPLQAFLPPGAIKKIKEVIDPVQKKNFFVLNDETDWHKL